MAWLSQTWWHLTGVSGNQTASRQASATSGLHNSKDHARTQHAREKHHQGIYGQNCGVLDLALGAPLPGAR